MACVRLCDHEAKHWGGCLDDVQGATGIRIVCAYGHTMGTAPFSRRTYFTHSFIHSFISPSSPPCHLPCEAHMMENSCGEHTNFPSCPFARNADIRQRPL